MGVRAAGMLIRMIKGEDLAAEAHIFSNEFIVRGSTGPRQHDGQQNGAGAVDMKKQPATGEQAR